MGTRFLIGIRTSDRQDGIQVIERAIRAVEDADRTVSTWRDDSELSAVNNAPVGTPVHLSRELAGILEEIQVWIHETGGSVNPAIGSLIDAWQLRRGGRVPSERELARALRNTGFDNFLFDTAHGTISRLSRDAWIDAGSFGKGLALRRVGQVLAARGIGGARVNFGGQLLFVGSSPAGTGQQVELADPRNRDHTGLWVSVPSGYSVATSSQSERFVDVGGRRFGHILDPQSGAPVEPWGSVTVITGDPLAADLLSTALFVMRADRALRFAERHPDIGVVVLEIEGDSLVSRASNLTIINKQRRRP